MPNRVSTQCVVTGPAERVAKFRAHVIHDAQKNGDAFDFERVIPMPVLLKDVVEGGYTTHALGVLGIWPNEFSRLPKAMHRAKLQAMPAAQLQEAIKQTLPAVECFLRYGYTSWYGWSIDHWGTKWNAYSTVVEEEAPGSLHFSFQTAWSFPTPIFEKLVQQWPDLRFEVWTFDEGWNFAGQGSFGGPGAKGIALNNNLDAKNPETRALYEKVYGSPPEDEDEEDTKS